VRSGDLRKNVVLECRLYGFYRVGAKMTCDSAVRFANRLEVKDNKVT
jgi:hypothetical protein